MLSDLTAQLPDLTERAYYKEALLCHSHGAHRAAVVMTWNIAYAHLCDHILAKRLAEFNARWLKSMPGMHKNGTKVIAVVDDFNDLLKESEVLTICRDGGIISRNVHTTLHTALGRRNTAAHPNKVVIDHFRSMPSSRI